MGGRADATAPAGPRRGCRHPRRLRAVVADAAPRRPVRGRRRCRGRGRVRRHAGARGVDRERAPRRRRVGRVALRAARPGERGGALLQPHPGRDPPRGRGRVAPARPPRRAAPRRPGPAARPAVGRHPRRRPAAVAGEDGGADQVRRTRADARPARPRARGAQRAGADGHGGSRDRAAGPRRADARAGAGGVPVRRRVVLRRRRHVADGVQPRRGRVHHDVVRRRRHLRRAALRRDRRRGRASVAPLLGRPVRRALLPRQPRPAGPGPRRRRAAAGVPRPDRPRLRCSSSRWGSAGSAWASWS